MKKLMLIAAFAVPLAFVSAALAQDGSTTPPPKKTKKMKKDAKHQMATTDKSDTRNDKDPAPVPPSPTTTR